MRTDTVYHVETPEGIDLHLDVAGIWVRAAAWLIDLLIRAVIYMLLSVLLTMLGLMGVGLLLIVTFTLEWFYPVIFEVFFHGMTPGKKTMGIRVINGDGTPVDWGSSIARNLLRTVDILPFFYGVGLISCLISRHFQRLGDLVADTLVVYNSSAIHWHEQPDAETLHLDLILTEAERRAFVSFADRLHELSNQRLEELTGIIQPVLQQAGLPVDSRTIVGIANGIIGRS